MPLGRYFAFVGSLLLALMFAADWFVPQPPAAQARVETDKGIRIASRHKWPEKIVFDTNLPTILPPLEVAELALDQPPPPAPSVTQLQMTDPRQGRSPRDAFAMAERGTSKAEPERAVMVRKAVQRPQQRTRTARAMTVPVAQQAPFGFRVAMPAGW